MNFSALAAYTLPDSPRRHPRPADLRNTRACTVEAVDGYARTAVVPSPVDMAHLLADAVIRPRWGDVRRAPGTRARLLALGVEIALADLTAALAVALTSLPPRVDVDPLGVYATLRLIAAERPDGAWMRRYAADVASACLRAGVFPAPDRPRRPRGPKPAPATPAERKARHLARRRQTHADLSRAWLRDMLADPERPTGRQSAPDLYAAAVDALSDEIESPGDMPTPQAFYAVADEVLGARSRSHGVRYYTLPDPTPVLREEPDMDYTETLREQNAELERGADLLERQAYWTERLIEQRERLTGRAPDRHATPSAPVVDLAAARAARRVA